MNKFTDALLRLGFEHCLLDAGLNWIPVRLAEHQNEQLGCGLVIEACIDLTAHFVVHKSATTPAQKNQVNVSFFTAWILLDAVLKQTLLEVDDDLVVQFRDKLA